MPQHVPNPRSHILHAGLLRPVSGVSAGIDADYIIKALKRVFFFFLINSQMCEMEFKELYIFIFLAPVDADKWPPEGTVIVGG